MPKPTLEKITLAEDASWAMFNWRREPEIPFEWHHHPEFELTLTLNSRGQRYVGDHIDGYDDGDLVLLGPNLPHTWSSSTKLEPFQPHVALVMQFRPEWADQLTGVLTELKPVRDLLARANRGIKFSHTMTQQVRPIIEAIWLQSPDQRLLGLLQILTTLATDRKYQLLSSPNLTQATPSSADRPRIDRVLEFIHVRYQQPIRVDDLAEIACLSPSGFHRLFRRHTRLTLGEYVAHLRIGQACTLLTNSEQPIAFIADAVGYASLANFNRQFKAIKSINPRAFRQRFRVTG
jgi:AraC-like DNA-binding protein